MPRAPRRCAGGHGTCTNLITAARYCPEHTQPWAGKRTSSSALTNTAAWKHLRQEVLDRDRYECQERGPACTGYADQVDHIHNTAAGGAKLDPDNCQAICTPCNARKAQRESTAARRRTRR